MSGPTDGPETLVLDASVAVDLLAGTTVAEPAAARLAHTELHAPAHLDAEVLSALVRLHRTGELDAAAVADGLMRLATMPLTRHPIANLAADAWARRETLRLVDALYVALAAHLSVPVLTTDYRLARTCPLAEALSA